MFFRKFELLTDILKYALTLECLDFLGLSQHWACSLQYITSPVYSVSTLLVVFSYHHGTDVFLAVQQS